MIEGLESAVENREFENNNDTALEESALESGGDVAKDTAKRPRLGKCKKVCKNDYCKVVCAADKDGTYFVKVHVGVVLNLVTPTGVHTFSLCQEDKCVEENGKVSTLGDTTDHTEISQEVLDDKKFYIVETYVTEVMEKKGWSFQKPLVTKMTSSNLSSNLPEPVVIIKKIGKKDN